MREKRQAAAKAYTTSDAGLDDATPREETVFALASVDVGG
jgi:hypothetical protein